MSDGQWAAYDRRRKKPERRIIFVSGDQVTSYRVRPWIAVPVLLLCGLFAVTYLAATAYLIYRDDLVAAVMNHNVRGVRAYEDRIASLRSEIDRISSRQILDQASYEEKIDSLLDRQDALNDRQRLVATLIDRARRSGLDILPSTGAPAEADPHAATEDASAGATPEAAYLPTPANAVAAPFAALLDPAMVEPAVPPAGGLRADGTQPDLAGLAVDLGRMTIEQTAAVDAIAATAEAEIASIEAIVEGVGIALPDDVLPDDEEDVGGPYMPASGAVMLAEAMAEADAALARLGAVRVAAAELPLGSPLPGATMTSRFGTRRDPFLRRPAFHSGLDFRAATGVPVRPTGVGRVVVAGRSGGYGNLVEIDHGNGMTTRYGHLSRIDVRVGDRVDTGTVVGLVGSTGRSTGPHLHYETRIEGQPVNPIVYIDAGTELEAHLQ